MKYLSGESLILAQHLIDEIRRAKNVPEHTIRFVTSIEMTIKSKAKISERQLESLKNTYERYTS